MTRVMAFLPAFSSVDDRVGSSSVFCMLILYRRLSRLIMQPGKSGQLGRCIGTRRHHAEALPERLRPVFQQGGVIGGIGHHILDISARLAERNRFSKDRALDRTAECRTPATRMSRPRIVGRRRLYL